MSLLQVGAERDPSTSTIIESVESYLYFLVEEISSVTHGRLWLSAIQIRGDNCEVENIACVEAKKQPVATVAGESLGWMNAFHAS